MSRTLTATWDDTDYTKTIQKKDLKRVSAIVGGNGKGHLFIELVGGYTFGCDKLVTVEETLQDAL